MTMKELTKQLSHPVEKEGLTQEAPPSGQTEGNQAGGKSNKEDKYGLVENIVIESLPPMREEGPRVFIIS